MVKQQEKLDLTQPLNENNALLLLKYRELPLNEKKLDFENVSLHFTILVRLIPILFQTTLILLSILILLPMMLIPFQLTVLSPLFTVRNVALPYEPFLC